MKIFNLPRGNGKTTRILYLSESSNTPILCGLTEQKKTLKENALKLGLHIPEPICVADIINGEIQGKNIQNVVVDEAVYTLDYWLNYYGLNITACSLSAGQGISED